MLRKTAISEGKDWDKLLLFWLYRAVPQASTGLSPFELLYGRSVRGPLDILREMWEASTKSSENIVLRPDDAGEAMQNDTAGAGEPL